jgi:uncharacterized protein
MKTLNEHDTWEVINAGKLGHLGCLDRGEPYVVPINYIVDAHHIYSHSLPGRKIQALRSYPRACLQVGENRNEFHWRSAIAFGRFEEINDDAQRRIILTRLLKSFPELTPVESELSPEGPPVIVFRLRIERVTGVAED